MRLPSGQRSTEWAARLPSVVAGLKGEVTRLTSKKPSDAIKAKTVAQKPSSVVSGRPVGLKKQRLPSGVGVRYLYQPGELECGRRSGTDPVWSLTVHRLGRPTLSFRRMGFSSAEQFINVRIHRSRASRKGTWSRRVRARPYSGAARRWAQTDKFGDGAPCTSVLHLPQHLLVGGAV